MNGVDMKNSGDYNVPDMAENDDMLPDYDVDFSKSLPNKFAERAALSIVLAPDVAQVFTTTDSVNKALRAIIAAMPEKMAR